MKKFWAFFMLACFLISGLPPAPAEPEEAGQPLMQIADPALPETLGKISSRFAGTTDRWVIVIQDIHAHLTAQENISAIVDHLNQVYGIETFALEGGWSKTKLIKSNKLPNSQAKQQLARALLEDAYLTGPAYSGLFSPAPLKLIGMENKSLYLQNRKAFLAQLEIRDQALAKLEPLKNEIAALKQETYNPGLLEFDHGLSLFREGKKAEVFLPALLETAEALKINFADLDQMGLFKEILTAEKAIDKEKLKSEAKRLIKFAGDARLSFEEVLRSGRIAETQLAHYPESLKFRQMLQLQDALSHHAFFEQIDLAINRVKDALIKNDQEKALAARYERFVLADKMLMLEAIPLDIKKAAAEIKTIRSEMEAAGLLEAFNKCVRFYVFAKKRDTVFFKNIATQPLLSGNVALVAGGFHTEGVTARLENEGISYMIITPSLGEKPEPPDQKTYIERMSEDYFTAAPQTLAQFAVFLRGVFDKKAFAEGVKTVEQTRDTREGVRTVLKWLQTSSPRETGKTASKAMSADAFIQLSAEEQKGQVEKWLEDIRQSKIPVRLGIRTSTLKKMLEDPAAWTYWKNYIVPDKFLSVGEFQDVEDYLVEPFIGMRRHPFKIKMPENGELDVKQLRKGEKKVPAALIDAEYRAQGKELLVLPVYPASFMAARLLLENKITGNVSEEFLKKTGDLLNEIFTAQGILEQAA